MAEVTSLNGQITDAVTQSNVMTLGTAPAQALSALYQTTAQAMAVAMQNAVVGQHGMATLSQVMLARCVETLGGSVAAKTLDRG
jgi:hypothetical protein